MLCSPSKRSEWLSEGFGKRGEESPRGIEASSREDEVDGICHVSLSANFFGDR